MDNRGMMHPGEPAEIRAIPVMEMPRFHGEMADAIRSGEWLASLSAVPVGGIPHLLAVLVDPQSGRLHLMMARPGSRYPALSAEIPQAHRFEREISEQWGIVPEGHEWLKPLRFSRPGDRPGVTGFFEVGGEEVHEVAVGPVHAGVIEPGHFRFQCHGELVMHLEIALGYQHRGVEKALVGGPGPRTVPLMETLAGDTTIGHATAYAQAVESLSGIQAPARAQALRAVALELERMANHTGDLGALSGDVAFLPTAAYCGRLRGDFLNLTALVCGSRFGRGLVRPGGTAFDMESGRTGLLLSRLSDAVRDFGEATRLMLEASSVTARFERIGLVDKRAALDIGLVGPAARASGVPRDVRFECPSGWYREVPMLPAIEQAGDVMARARVRWQEVHHSSVFIRQVLGGLPAGETRTEVGPLRPDAVAVSLVEGWRGAICHVAVTGSDGKFASYKVVDPSFHNWTGLAWAMRDGQISDFPLCNKSFNLSYCGHDL
jgi:Ni,Fe-hydrogenase III large subunit